MNRQKFVGMKRINISFRSLRYESYDSGILLALFLSIIIFLCGAGCGLLIAAQIMAMFVLFPPLGYKEMKVVHSPIKNF